MTYGMASVFSANVNDQCYMLLTRRGPFSAVLLLAVTVLALTPIAGSQSLTTITSLTTATHQMTNTSYSTTPVRTTTATSTVTATLLSLTTFTVRAAEPRRCYHNSFTYDGVEGERLQGRWTSNYIINFYVVSASNYAKYKYCGQPGSPYLKVEWHTSYSLNWLVPASEVVYFIFENYAVGTDVASERTISFELYKVGPQSETSVLYSTRSAELILKSTETASSIQYSTIQSSLEGITSPVSLAAIGVIAGVLIVVAIVTILRRQNRTVAAKTRKRGKVEKGKYFCINCGAELSGGSKFCNKCGSSQP
jgi:hypothetical protein